MPSEMTFQLHFGEEGIRILIKPKATKSCTFVCIQINMIEVTTSGK